MKLSALSVPLFVSGLLCVAIWGFGQLTVQAGRTATETSLELLRQQLEIQRLQEQLVARSHGHLQGQLQGLPMSQSSEGDRLHDELSDGDPEATRVSASAADPSLSAFRFDTTQPKPWPTP